MRRHLEQTPLQNTKQIQKLILSPQMQQALHLLQLPLQELSLAINEELNLNPLLETSEDGEDFDMIRQFEEEFSFQNFPKEREEEDLKALIENTIAYENSLFDHLMQQARDVFSKDDLILAETLVGHFDQNGFLTTPLEEIALLFDHPLEKLSAVLKEIQGFDPIGVGACNLKESLMIQLKAFGKETSLAFRIIENNFDDLIHNRIPLIAKTFHKSANEIREVIEREISIRDLHPGTGKSDSHYKQCIQHLIPDVTIRYIDGKFTIEVNDERIPHLRLNRSYLKMLEDHTLSRETRSYIQEKIASGKWLVRNLHERNHTLYRIALQISQSQSSFLIDSKGNLTPMTMKEMAEKLELHESTIARAVANKYLNCSRGILPLRSFFTNAYMTDQGENISSSTVKDLLKEMISNENPHSPLSDETISNLIKKKGIPCARRTVAKYRQELGIGNTTQRKIY